METIKRADLFKKLGTFKSVSNTPSRNGYGTAPNQFELIFENGRAFQSYHSLIAVWYGGKWYFTREHDCSVTTSGHIGRYCGIKTKERREGLRNGTYTYIED